MESINQRIKRLRVAKPASIKQLADFAGVTYQSVQEWEREGGTAPTRKRQGKVAEFLGVSVPELLTGADQPKIEIDSPDLQAREGIMLLLFRGLFSHQQKECIDELRALFEANRYTRKLMGTTPLLGVSNEAVRAAFGDVPAPSKTPPRRRKPPPNLKGSSGDHLGDQDVE